VTSALISGVKNFESKAVSLLRGLPFSQVQSQSEKGTIFPFFAGAASEEGVGVCATNSLGAAVEGAALVATGAWAKFDAVTAGTVGPDTVLSGAGAASLPLDDDAGLFCPSTSARRRSTSARNAFNSSRISCCSLDADELESVLAEEVAWPWAD